jgi:hypothetical protein
MKRKIIVPYSIEVQGRWELCNEVCGDFLPWFGRWRDWLQETCRASWEYLSFLTGKAGPDIGSNIVFYFQPIEIMGE